jgi:hypothetical protein
MLPAHEEILSIQLVTNNKYARQVRSCAAGLTYENVSTALTKLKADKPCGPDKVAPKLLKKAGHTVIPSLLSLY